MKLNKKIIWILIAALLAGGVWFVFMKPREGTEETGGKAGAKYFCPMHPHYTSDKPGDCPICNMRLVPIEKGEGRRAEGGERRAEGRKKKILFYRHPMRADVSSPVPAKDEMGMDYIPVYEEETAQDIKSGILAKEGYAPVVISSRKQQLIGMRTGPVERKDVSKVIRTVGKIAYDPELYQAQSEYIQSLKALRNLPAATPPGQKEWAEKLVDSARTKLTLMGLNSGMIDAMAQEEAPDKSLLYAVPGAHAWVYANIFEYEIPLVKVGDLLEIETTAMPGAALSGEIRSIDTLVDPMTRSVRVRAAVENKEGFLKPDMFVNASLKADLGNVLVVPEEAVLSTGTSHIVFVDQGEGLFEPRRILPGQRAEGVYEVKEGLKEGERVVTNGNFLVDSESRLKAALTSMSEEKR